MSTSSPAPGAAPADSVSPDGVYTYRGRTIEELIPRIRAELGANAIILREREGVTGGIAGFFAQRCVEVDARRGSGISLYDDDLSEEEERDLEGEGLIEDDPSMEAPAPAPEQAPAPAAPASYEQPTAYETDDPAAVVASRSAAAFVARSQPSGPFKAYAMSADPDQPRPAAAPREDVPAAPVPPAAPPAPTAPAAAAPAAPAAPTAPSAPASPAAPAAPTAPATPELPAGGSIFDEASFAARLEEATIAPEPAPAFIAFDELGEPTGEPEPAVEPEPVAEPELIADAEPVAAPEPELVAEPEPVAVPEPVATTEPAPASKPAAAARPTAQPPRAPSPSGPAPRPASSSVASTLETIAVRGREKLAPMARGMMKAARSAHATRTERRNEERRARAAAEAEARREHEARARAREADARAREAERLEATEVERKLVEVGIGQATASRVVAAAVAERQPDASSSLTDDVRAAIASALPVPPPPVSAGAVAIIGAGGSGKTRSAVALASARARAGVTPVTVAGIATMGPEGELGELLHGESVNVIPELRNRALARAVSNARQSGLVVLDTCSATPGDAQGMTRLAADLAEFAPDEIQLAVPATLSAHAVARLIESFESFAPAGLIATHLDETDQLGAVVELAVTTRIPITYTHTGLDVATALEAADPSRLAARLL